MVFSTDKANGLFWVIEDLIILNLCRELLQILLAQATTVELHSQMSVC